MAIDRSVCWRLNPPPGIHHQVRTLALREGRSVSNMLLRLVAEALDARKISDAAQNPEVLKFMQMITAASNAPQR
jgi:hypothetical protein